MSGAPLLLGVNLRIGFALPSWSTQDPECVDIIPRPFTEAPISATPCKGFAAFMKPGRVTGKVL